MGIKGLTSLIQKYAPSSIETVNLHALSNKKLAIDASLFIYKMAFSMRGNKSGKNFGHIIGIFQKTINYLAVGIEPIYIFDGKPPQEKNTVLKERREKSQQLKILMEESTETEKKEKYKAQSYRLSREDVDNVKNLLSLMGVSYIQADGEAEGYASELCKIGYVDGVVTEDMDSLAFGTPILVRSNIDRTIKRRDVISIIHMEKILQEMELTFDEFLDVCIMSGCDYCENIKGIGSNKSFQKIKEHKTIEKFVENYPGVSDEYLPNVQKSRELFKIFDNKLNKGNIKKSESLIDRPKLKSFLVEMCGMSEKRFNNAMVKIRN